MTPQELREQYEKERLNKALHNEWITHEYGLWLESRLIEREKEVSDWQDALHACEEELAKQKAEAEQLKGKPYKCPVCNGSGQLQVYQSTLYQPCHACNKGIIWKEIL